MYGAHIINLDEYSDIETHWVALWVNNSNNITYIKHLLTTKTLK